jgi:hypothetical protein
MPYHDPGKISSMTPYKKPVNRQKKGTEKERSRKQGNKKTKEKENP